MLPVYANVDKMPAYLSNVTLDTSTENFYWASRLIDAMADHDFASCMQPIERYHVAVMIEGRKILRRTDARIRAGESAEILEEANEELCRMARKETTAALGKILQISSESMKNGFRLADK